MDETAKLLASKGEASKKHESVHKARMEEKRKAADRLAKNLAARKVK